MKWPGKTDPVALKADPLGYFHVHERQADRDPEAAPDNLVQVAVGRVGIAFAVPAESAHAEQLVLDCVGKGVVVCARSRIDARLFRHHIQPGSSFVDIRVGVADAGDEHGRAKEIDFVVGALDRRGKGFEIVELHCYQYTSQTFADRHPG